MNDDQQSMQYNPVRNVIEPICSTSLQVDRVSNFSTCPSTPNRKLIVRAICAAGSFSDVSWINGGKETSRIEWNLGMSWLDALLNGLVFAIVLWIGGKENEAVRVKAY